MKRSVTNILNDCQPQELDSLLENINITLPEDVDADAVTSLATQKAGVVHRRHTARRAALIAACVALLAGILVGCYVAEQNEYNSAVRFFDLNNLDTAGLSRDDIKRVYRDMTTESFSRDESAELLLQNSDNKEIYATGKSTDRVEGLNISIMNSANNADIGTIEQLYGRYPSDDAVGHGNIPDKTMYFVGDELEKTAASETVWRTKLPHCYEDYYISNGKALIWGSYIYDTKHDYMHTSVALIDDSNGKLLWEKTLDTKYNFDEDAVATINDNGYIGMLTLATDDRFSEEKMLVFRELDDSGEIVTEQEQEQSIIFNNRITALSDGWLAEVSYSLPQDSLADRLIKLSPAGEIQAVWALEDADDTEYEVVAMTEYDGKIYLSVQARWYGSQLYDDLVWDDPSDSGFTDTLRDTAREVFSSVLFVCDPDSGKPEEFYSVGGTMPGSLSVDDGGCLVWHVGRIVKCGYCPYASSFTFYGFTRRYDYTFDSDNNKLKEEKTDIFNSFYTI